VILSGTASDGTEGCRAIKAAGGITFAQDEDSAKFSGMPRSAVGAGCIDFVMKPSDIAQELVRVVSHPYVAPFGLVEEGPALSLAPGRDMDELLRLVADASGVDFSLYKQTTLQRRIRRRMVVHRMEKLSDYVRYVKSTPSELDELYRDILIHVTGFFRDPAAFEALRTVVFPSLLKNRNLNDFPLRIWVPGCSTGEEVYSIAMLLLEYLWEKHERFSLASIGSKVVQIFATDISDNALDRGRSGLYTESAAGDLSPERLAKFFVKIDGGYQINKALREMCIFAKQNVTKDPPFSNLDLISCRNLLIYLGAVLQKRVIPTFHYALKPEGYLMLGGSESLGALADHFTLVDKKQKIYQKKRSASRLIGYFAPPTHFPRRTQDAQLAKASTSGVSAEKEAERVLMSRFLPPSIVVNDQMEVVHVRGRTGAYLELAEGHPSASLSKMAREGLLVDLHAALRKAKKSNATVHAEGVQVRSNGGTTEVNLTVSPIRVEGTNGKYYLVVFQEAEAQHAVADKHRSKPTRKDGALSRDRDRLRQENGDLKEQLRTLLEDHETTTEEFKSANEEVLSANEELQSTNEELETAKEELQSGNEELNTLNEELHNRNSELSLANNDLVNLLASVNLAIVMVGSDLRIRRFTPPAEKLLNLIAADVGRRIGEIRPNLTFDDLEKLVSEVVETAVVQQHEVQGKDGKWHLLRVRPYKTWDSKIDGAVISFQDIDALKRTLDETRAYANALIENAREAIIILDGELRVTLANDAFFRAFGVSARETENRSFFELGSGQWNIPKLRDQLKKVGSNHARIDNLYVEREFPHLGTRTMVLNARTVQPESGTRFVLLTIEDITERERQLAAISTQSACWSWPMKP
jgi:two-component system CheB/CheR fusion protein